MYLAQSPRKTGAKCSSCRVRGQRLSYRHSELGAKLEKKKARNVQAYCSLFSLFSLFSGKGKRKKKSILFFSFSLQQNQQGKQKTYLVLLSFWASHPTCLFVESGSTEQHAWPGSPHPCPLLLRAPGGDEPASWAGFSPGPGKPPLQGLPGAPSWW